ncbi:MAG: DNA replication/repair protein RecF [Clostridia bacterium]|nr:DNA replication/repair protein RecF [Clostridia bacterium]
MTIEQIKLIHFRNYDQLTILPHEGINIFFGQNGSGKTNLLEAIHYCALGKSHRINQDTGAVMMGEAGCSCQMSVRNQYSRNDIEVRLRPGEENVKSVWIDQKKAARLSEMMGVLRCVIFSPEDLSLIKEGPSIRRKFLDMMISQISRNYFVSLQQYRVAMSQRAAILRQARMDYTRPDPMIEDFEMAMAEHAKVIYQERVKYTEMLSTIGHQLYQQISGKDTEDFVIHYRSQLPPEKNDPLFLKKLLEKQREDDMRQGSTQSGPHRDDLILTLNGKHMKSFASQGQIRTAALSLKLAQMKIFTRITNEHPILLLDDVMSELDLNRRMNLLDIVSGVQTFITCSDEGDLAEYQNNRTYHVHNSEGIAQIELIKEGPDMHKLKFSEEPVFE